MLGEIKKEKVAQMRHFFLKRRRIKRIAKHAVPAVSFFQQKSSLPAHSEP